MAAKRSRRPTDAELGILQVLWDRGPSTVREVKETLGAGSTSALKLLQIMLEKGLVTRDESVRPQVYSARRTRRQTQRQLLGDLAERAFGGSRESLVLQALSGRTASKEERQRIRELLDAMEHGEEGT